MKLPPDPFGIKSAELFLWREFSGSGAADHLFSLLSPDRALLEREILCDRLDGISRSDGALSAHTLGDFLRRFEFGTPETLKGAIAQCRAALERRGQFLSGRCDLFALAAHERTGWPIRVIAEEQADGGRWPMHVVLEMPDGAMFDVLGARSVDSLADFYEVSHDKWLEVSSDALRKGMRISADISLDAARMAVDVVLGDDLAPRCLR